MTDNERRLIDILVEVSEFLDNYADVVDGPSDELGPSQRPNRAMSLQVAVDNAIDRANGYRERHSY